MKAPTGYVIYQGPSLLDGAPIVAIALTGSDNRKTGNMVQTYILRADVKPTEAVRDGRDASICGDCKHRPALGGACYVVVAQGPTVVFKQFAKGGYPQADIEQAAALGAGRMVRLGTYGDPAAVPAHVWEALLSRAKGHTGYTHQWRKPEAAALRALCMASADSPEERAQAHAQGWRTFRVRLAEEERLPGEFVCPASEEAGKRKTCLTCGACDGAQRGNAQASPVIFAHGAKARRFIAVRQVQ
jgi:hypothetical protein